MEKLFFNLTLNTRDLGGYLGNNNRTTRYHHLVRSDALRYIDEKDKEYLLKNKITTQIDLRTEEIANKYPSMLKDDNRFSYHLIPIEEGSLKSLEDCNSIPLLYMKMIHNKKAFYNIFKTISSIKDGFIINCTAGKDRTGIVSYMLLTLAGVDKEEIKKDYLLSNACIEENLPKVREAKPNFPSFLGFAKEEYLDGFLLEFYKEYKSVEDYLLSLGITNEEINIIKERMF